MAEITVWKGNAETLYSSYQVDRTSRYLSQSQNALPSLPAPICTMITTSIPPSAGSSGTYSSRLNCRPIAGAPSAQATPPTPGS